VTAWILGVVERAPKSFGMWKLKVTPGWTPEE
jgi:hypothetical protein